MTTNIYPTKDAWITERFPNATHPYGSLHICDGDKPEDDPPPLTSRTVLQFDVSSLSLEDVHYVRLALRTLSAYGGMNPQFKEVSAYKLLRTDWVESQVSWLFYKAGLPWSSVGGDYAFSDPTPGRKMFGDWDELGEHWFYLDATAIVRDAIINEIPASIIVMFTAEYIVVEDFTLAQFWEQEGGGEVIGPRLIINPDIGVGYIWIEGTKLAYTDSVEAKRLKEGTDTGANGSAEYPWVDGTYIYYVDANGDVRRIEGTLTGLTGKIPSQISINTKEGIDGTKFCYIDATGAERCFEGSVP
jgi:hypothetical protein